MRQMRSSRLCLLFPAFYACLYVFGIAGAEQREGVPMNDETAIELGIGGVGGAYFLAEPGELIIDLEKRDRNIRRRQTELRAVLVGPDRQVIQEVRIPDDGQSRGSGTGPAQRVRLSAQVARKGIYGLNVTVSHDRYGQEIIWGFRTNCARYVIETSRGHRDERHQEPLVLLNPDRAGDVCFAPRRGAFEMEVTDLPEGVDALPVYDANGARIHTLAVRADGVSHTFPADVSREAVPWRLHLPVQQATVHIDGVTRWQRRDPYENLSYWTPRLETFFPFHMYRWMLTPYSRTVYVRPGSEGEMAFRAHNNSDRKRAFALSIEFPAGAWPAHLSAERVVVGAKQSEAVTVRYQAGADSAARICHVRIAPETQPEVTTYATLIVRTGEAPAERPLEMPITFTPYRHENEQFGYLPDYPVENQVYFDLENRPVVRVRKGIEAWLDGGWVAIDLRTAVKTRAPSFEGDSFSLASTKVAFDRDNDLYLLANAGRRSALLHSADCGRTFAAYLLGGDERRRGAMDFEQFSGHNTPDGPPAVLRSVQTAADKRLRWRRICDLELFLPEKTDGRLSVGEPISISDRCLGVGAHSGIPSSIVSRGPKVHIVWGEATDPDADVPGVPTYVASYDRETGQMGEPVLIGHGAPPNDGHNKPCMTMDSQGYLHVLAGTHGRPFPYARSLKPNDAYSGWTQAEAAGEDLNQTYVGMVCGPDDTLHLVFRLWRYGVEPHPASHHATLAYQRKRPGQPWEAPKVLIVAPFSEYSIFYHRLTIDRAGRLFLSYDYWSTFWFYRTDHFGRRRALVMSADGGENWKLVSGADLHR